MSIVNNTPPLNAAGLYVVENPYTINETKTYICQSIEGFEDLEEQGINVFETYYQPVGLSYNIFKLDKKNGINIITLMQNEEPTLKIPSSYILEFPRTTTIPYSDMYLSVHLGMLPDGIGLDDVIDAIRLQTQQLIGTNKDDTPVVVGLHKVTTTPVTPSDHEMLEKNRQGRILRQKNVYEDLQDKIKALGDKDAKNIALGKFASAVLSKYPNFTI